MVTRMRSTVINPRRSGGYSSWLVSVSLSTTILVLQAARRRMRDTTASVLQGHEK